MQQGPGQIADIAGHRPVVTASSKAHQVQARAASWQLQEICVHACGLKGQSQPASIPGNHMYVMLGCNIFMMTSYAAEALLNFENGIQVLTGGNQDASGTATPFMWLDKHGKYGSMVR